MITHPTIGTGRTKRSTPLRAGMVAGMVAALALTAAIGTGTSAFAGTAMDTGAPAAPLILKQRATVAGDQVYLSDLFSNVPFTQDIAISDAPAPGATMAFSARQLGHITRQAKLYWAPSDPNQGVVVSRDSQSIPMSVVERAIAGAIAEQYIGGDFDVSVFERSLNLHIPAGEALQVIVSDLDFDARSNRFRAKLTAAGTSGQQVEVAGRVEAMVDLPVLNRHMMPGEIIAERDIAWQRVSARRATTTAISRLGELVGQTPRRPIASGQPIRMTDVVPDYLVQKGDVVTILLQNGKMTLTARGTALQRGARGDVIRVRNSQSRKTIEGQVASPDMVIVRPAQYAQIR
jgi:flagella basal body P-ring formation protein FlgA